MCKFTNEENELVVNIKRNAKYLRLTYISNNFESIIKDAELNELTITEFLSSVLQNEADLRKENGVNTKTRLAKFNQKLYLEDFTLDDYDAAQRKKIKEIITLDFIGNKQNVIMFGNAGVVKTHLATGLALKTCLKNKNVLIISVPNLMIEIKEQMNLNQLNRYRKNFEKYDLVILVEMGYVSFDKDIIEILFNLLSNRNQNASTIITTNLTFDRWNQIFKDQVLTTGIVDRLAYKEHILDFSGQIF